jgi:hypothetical protein
MQLIVMCRDVASRVRLRHTKDVHQMTSEPAGDDERGDGHY